MTRVSRSSSLDDDQRLPNELLSLVAKHASLTTLKSLSLASSYCATLARPLLWRRLTLSTQRNTSAELRSFLAGARIDDFVHQLKVIIHNPTSIGGASSSDHATLVSLIVSLLVRLPNLVDLRLAVTTDENATTSEAVKLLDGLRYMHSSIRSFSIEWFPSFGSSEQRVLFDGIRRHKPTLDTVSLYCDGTTRLGHDDIEALSHTVSLTVDRFEVSMQACQGRPFDGLFDRLVHLDVDSSVYFDALCHVLLPSMPLLERLYFYLVFDTQQDTLGPLPPLEHLYFIEARSVCADDVTSLLSYVAPLTSVRDLIISADKVDLVEVAKAIIDVLDTIEGRASTADERITNAGLALPKLDSLQFAWEGEGETPGDELEWGSEQYTELAEAMRQLQPRLGARGIKVVAPGMP